LRVTDATLRGAEEIDMKRGDGVIRMAVLGCLAGPLVQAWASPQIAAKAGCVACHVADKKLIGPSSHDIAAK
jgi:cytochrome c551/c552